MGQDVSLQVHSVKRVQSAKHSFGHTLELLNSLELSLEPLSMHSMAFLKEHLLWKATSFVAQVLNFDLPTNSTQWGIEIHIFVGSEKVVCTYIFLVHIPCREQCLPDFGVIHRCTWSPLERQFCWWCYQSVINENKNSASGCEKPDFQNLRLWASQKWYKRIRRATFRYN